MSFSSNVFSIERGGHIATLWLDRPEKRNAMAQEFWTDLPYAMKELGDDPEVRAVVLAGRGKSFCVGLDLSAVSGGGVGGDAQKPASAAEANLKQMGITRAFQAAISSVADCPVPVIAAIHNHCIGGGIDLVTACDIRLASEDAIFGIRETKIGITADVGTLQRLPGIITKGHVAELAYTGRDFNANYAQEIGLVNRVVADQDAVLKAAYELAEEIAANAPLAVRGTKFMLQQGEDLTTEQSLLLNGLWTMIANLGSNDLKEAVSSFMEKRPPTFKGN
ncbi:MAG: crotonase/enoyl-CoA hydratase family protein [Myxococcota bacterium]|jgi:enoyl-CoA hydratase|nr:crotonase/enoyl-CoA hydratase family protein [Myxococcota bacterium]